MQDARFLFRDCRFLFLDVRSFLQDARILEEDKKGVEAEGLMLHRVGCMRKEGVGLLDGFGFGELYFADKLVLGGGGSVEGFYVVFGVGRYVE